MDKKEASEPIFELLITIIEEVTSEYVPQALNLTEMDPRDPSRVLVEAFLTAEAAVALVRALSLTQDPTAHDPGVSKSALVSQVFSYAFQRFFCLEAIDAAISPELRVRPGILTATEGRRERADRAGMIVQNTIARYESSQAHSASDELNLSLTRFLASLRKCPTDTRINSLTHLLRQLETRVRGLLAASHHPAPTE